MSRIKAFLTAYDHYWSTKQAVQPKQVQNPITIYHQLIRSFVQHKEFNFFFADFDNLGKNKWAVLQELYRAFPSTKIFRCRNYWRITIDVDALRAYAR